MMWRNPLRALPTMMPVCPVVRSSILLRSPWGVSLIVTRKTSPGFINSVCAFGVNDASVKLSGPAGPVGLPLRWMNAKAVGSSQFSFNTLKSKFPCRLLMCIDAHQCVWSQENWSMNGDHPRRVELRLQKRGAGMRIGERHLDVGVAVRLTGPGRLRKALGVAEDHRQPEGRVELERRDRSVELPVRRPRRVDGELDPVLHVVPGPRLV